MSPQPDEDQAAEAVKLHDSNLASHKRYNASEKGKAKIQRQADNRRKLKAKVQQGLLSLENQEDRLLIERVERERMLARERGRKGRLSEKGKAREARAYEKRKARLQAGRAIRKAQSNGGQAANSPPPAQMQGHELRDAAQQPGDSAEASSSGQFDQQEERI